MTLLKRRRRYGIEVLEERLVPTTYVVTDNSNINVVGTFAWAVEQSETNAGPDEITFDLPPGNESIRGGGGDTNPDPAIRNAFGNSTTDFIITDALTITGPSTGAGVSLVGNGVRLFGVTQTGNLSIRYLTVSGFYAEGGIGGNNFLGGGGGGGLAAGGAVWSLGIVTIENSTFVGNTAKGGDGNLGQSIISLGGGGGGSAKQSGSGGPTDLGRGGGGGAGIGGLGQINSGNTGGKGGFAQDVVTFAPPNANGTLGGGGGGGDLATDGGDGTGLSTIVGLGGGGGGGGGDSTGNAGVGGEGGFGSGGGGGGAGGDGGSTTGAGGTGGNAGFGGGGGGGGRSTNLPGGAGGVSYFGGGSGGDGNTTFAGGGGGGGLGAGGAIFNQGGALTIVNSTFANNTATGGLPGFSFGNMGSAGSGFGGAIFNYNGTVSILNSTFSGNAAKDGDNVVNDGGSIYNLGDGAASTVVLNNAILANSTSTTEFRSTTINAGSQSSSGAGNLIEGGSVDFSGTVVSTADPLLGSLTNNGGPTDTYYPNLGSPASDAGDDAAAAGLLIDQRGFAPRTINGTVDIGSVETAAIGPVEQVGGVLTITLTTSNDTITFTQNSAGTVSFVIGAASFGPYSGVTSIVVNALAGDDIIRLANAVRIPMSINGGDGTDTLDASAIASLISTIVGSKPGTPSLFDSVEVLDVGNVVFLKGAAIDGTINANGGYIDFSRLGFPIDADLDRTGPNVNGRLSAQNVDLVIGSLFTNNSIKPASKNGTNFLGRIG